MLTQFRLKQIFNYDKTTGEFTWKETRCGLALCGAPAGSLNDRGYVRIRTNGESFLAHRLAWLFVTGAMPAGDIDHIDGNKANNRISNLRDDTCGRNLQNQRLPHRSGKSGYFGVCWHKKSSKWIAQIRINKSVRYIGTFDSPEIAHAAYVTEKRKSHEFNTL